MKPMEIQPECLGCLERLVELAVSLATADPELRGQARVAARKIIAREFRPGAIPARIANRYHLAIQAVTGNSDPFGPRKAAETAFLARLYEKTAPAYGEDLHSLLKLAVLGNAVDYFREEAEVAEQMFSPVEFAVSHLPDFLQELSRGPGLLLYLADNAGEQFFDRPLLDHLRSRGWEARYVVKGGPIQNDMTRMDLYASGLGEALEPVADSGARTVGLELERVSPEFQRLFDRADLILAKGMGHFETLSHTQDPRVFFLLQAKCPPVALALGVPPGGFVFGRGTFADG
jgi:uncharacterized protein with ATP-grasp and redox domains